ncbi:PREDICTED: uncharacterized protein LOC108376681 [Rhagoletis zephyria]|nr:PREDICTED: uncharacterized protein LOC108376681 [Rhagoletis zephyria]XP_036318579.1 uncharacterized protein LOC118733331 [Rhagoletis pomonella]
MLHHKNLLRYESEIAPVQTAPVHHRHHLNTRSLDMNCAKVVEHISMLRKQARTSFNALNNFVYKKFTEPRFNLTPEIALEEWSKYKLNLSHPYTKLMDREFTKEKVHHDISHLENGITTLNEKLIQTELNKIYKTIRMLQVIHNRTYNALDKKWQDDAYKNVTQYLNHTGSHLSANIKATNSVIATLNVALEDFDENSISYNETVQVLDWLVVAESISFFQYLDKLYEKLMEMCSAPRYLHEGNM